MEEAKTLKGTTTVGLVCSDGVLLAADKRATMGYFIANREVEKIFQIDDVLALTVAGSVGDAQTLVRYMKYEAQLYKMNYGKPMSVSAATTLLSNILAQYKFAPFYVQILVGGFDGKPRIFNLDPVGGVTEEKFVSTGSGSPVAYGLLEDAFRDDKSIKDNLKIALRALSAAMKRDVGTGDGIDLVSITPEEFKRYDKDTIKKLLETKHE
ncbi:MAG: Proteasome subunit beta, archaeal [Candidatus Fermentimicrarchaeum limneticum]|uniref:Proteasome subunit beta n=1 Tax=Fermentimicrarchaeum limneticum TaxID=2795018 RepID=A0A7D6BNV9_FERL1|nr:MAG: Proteasome subunit beta, archaeal [Candidatus Fermentimicrarchaeum limneticum]